MAEEVSPKPRAVVGRSTTPGPRPTGTTSTGATGSSTSSIGRANGRRLTALTRDSDPTSSARRRVLDRISSTDEGDVPQANTPSARLPSVRPTANGAPTGRVSSMNDGPVQNGPNHSGDIRTAVQSTTQSDGLRRSSRTPLGRGTRDVASSKPPRASVSSAIGPATPHPPNARAHEDLDLASAPPSPSSRFAPLSAPQSSLRSSAPHDDIRSAPSLALSPRMTAIFGGLFGLATITTIIALLIQAAPPKDERGALGSAAPIASTSKATTAPPPPVSHRPIRIHLPSPWRISDLEKDPSVKIVSDAMDHRSFVAALSDKNVGKDQIYRILKAFENIRKFDKSAKGDRFIAAIDRETKELKAFEYVVSPLEIYQAREQNGVLTASQLDMKIADNEVTGSIYIGKNLTKSIEDAGLEDGLTKVIDDAYAGRMSSEGLEEGGTLRVIAIETTALGEFAKYKQVVAIDYHPADPAAAPVRAYDFDGGGASPGALPSTSRVHGYFDEKGRQQDGSGWAIPVPGAPITSRFNLKRMHPILHKIVPHTGTDFGAPSGTPIYAAFKGKITNWGPAGPCGNMAQIDHPGSIQTGYCHMSKFAPGLKLGSMVGTKQLIGYVGTTGRSTGPHLHFWAKRDGKFFDSETLHMNGMHAMPPEYRDAFAARKAELDASLDALPMPEPPPPPAADSKDDKASAKDEAKDDDSKKDSRHNDDPDTDEKTDGDKSTHAKTDKTGERSSASDKSDKSDKGEKPSKASSANSDDGEDLVGADLGK